MMEDDSPVRLTVLPTPGLPTVVTVVSQSPLSSITPDRLLPVYVLVRSILAGRWNPLALLFKRH